MIRRSGAAITVASATPASAASTTVSDADDHERPLQARLSLSDGRERVGDSKRSEPTAAAQDRLREHSHIPCLHYRKRL